MAERISDNEKAMVDEPEKPRSTSVTDYISELEQGTAKEIAFADIIRGTAHAQLTTFEKKAALINLEIDKFGMGKYQWCVWFLCGFGYFLDLAWAQGVSLGAIAMFQEFGVPSERKGDIYACANAGLAIGALSFGILVDVIGRKWAFNLTCLITSFFGLFLAAPYYNYGAICAIYFLSSLGLGGNIPIDATIVLEFLPQNRRYLTSLLSMWQPIGVVVASAIAYGTVAKYRCDPSTKVGACTAAARPCCEPGDNMGWRYLFIILGLMTLFVFFARFVIFNFHESPKFLLGKGKEQEAIDVLHKIAKYNGAPPPSLTVEMFREIDELGGPEAAPPAYQNKQVLKTFVGSFTHLKGLFKNRLQLFIFGLLAIAYMGDYWSFNLAGGFLPIILAQNAVDKGANSVTETYRQYIYIYLPGILGAGLALASVQLPLVGRKWSLVFSALCQGLSMALYTQVRSTVGYVGLNALEYLMQTYFNAVLYASAPELFDTVYRGSASGMLSCLGRLAGIVAPFAGAKYLASSSSGILWLGAGGIWLAAFTMVFLPVEMRDRQMY